MADKQPEPVLVRVRVPDRFETFEDHKGVVHTKGDVVEVTKQTAEAHGLAPVKDALSRSTAPTGNALVEAQKDAEKTRVIQATEEAAKAGAKGKELERVADAAKTAAEPAPANPPKPGTAAARRAAKDSADEE